MVVKPANGSGGYGVFVGSMATKVAKDEMRRRVEANPRNYIAQPIVQLSTCPDALNGRIVPRHLDLRPFILSGEQPYVTAGGLTRVALKEGSLVVNSSQGGGSKDTWVIDPTVVPPRASTARHSRANTVSPVGSHDQGGFHVVVPGRRVGVLGRALPRAGRGDRPASPRPHRAVPGPAESRRRRLGTAVGGHRERRSFHDRHTRASEEEVVEFLATSSEHQGSIVSSIARPHANLRVTQAILPSEAWGVLHRLHLWAGRTRNRAVDRRTRLGWTDQLIRQCQLFSGLLEGTMSHDETYSFLVIGRDLERADMTTRVLDIQAGMLIARSDGANPYADLMWMGVLRSLSALQMFRRVAGPMVSAPRR